MIELKIILDIVWVVLSLFSLEYALTLINQPSTILVTCGAGIVSIEVLSYMFLIRNGIFPFSLQRKKGKKNENV